MASSPAVSYAGIVAAQAALPAAVRQTPVLESRALAALAGGPVWVKCEHLQRTGSFKIRGAYWRISRLTAAERDRGVIAASAGNHAQGVALAASMLGAKATVVMPGNAQLPKVEATRSYGAQVVLHGTAIEDAMARAREIAEETGSVFIHPFEHPDIIAGQGTVGLEIAGQCPQARTVVVPVGGGGLASGIALAMRGAGSAAAIVGVQAAAMAPFGPSAAAGHPVTVPASATMADGIAVAVPGELAVRILGELADRFVAVSEESLSRAMLMCLERIKQLVEPAGAAGVAALLEYCGELEPPVVIVLSGGNIDPLLLSRVLRRGLAAAGRYMAFRCRLPDRPGALAALLAELAALGTNVMDVLHERLSAELLANEVEVVVRLETRGPEHCDAVLSQLASAGYGLQFL